MFCYQWDLFGETAAAWIQAIGSIGALGITVWLFERDRRHRQGEEVAHQQKEAAREQANAEWQAMLIFPAIQQLMHDFKELQTKLLDSNPNSSLEFRLIFINKIQECITDPMAFDSEVTGLIARVIANAERLHTRMSKAFGGRLSITTPAQSLPDHAEILMITSFIVTIVEKLEVKLSDLLTKDAT